LAREARTAITFFLRLYRMALASGILATRPGRRLFETAYRIYKRTFEGRSIAGLRRFVPPGSLVVDAGANIGIFTEIFAGWVGPAGRVVAIEPEAVNAARLRDRVAGKGLGAVVDIVEGAAGEYSGQARLAVNPHHPGDHRLAESGIAVRMVALDELLNAERAPVSLIKIDVQGAEVRVIDGARGTIARHRPALFVEIDDSALRAMGSSAVDLAASLLDLGYRPHALSRSGDAIRLDIDTISKQIAERGYTDVLFLHGDAADRGAW